MTAYRLCAQCSNTRIADGGVELRSGKWLCARCWIKRINTPR
jgi:hypothetical protein